MRAFASPGGIGTGPAPVASGTGDAVRVAGPLRAIGASVDDRAREREQIDRARQELVALEDAYRRAMERGLAADSLAGIDAAFDEADRLQGRLLVSIRRLCVLEHESGADGSEPASGPGPSAGGRAERTDRTALSGSQTRVRDAA